ncbi:TetR family transcriptional regulator [Paenibacillus sp. HN-1]|nr:TetR family transcriptional regulator [Paenibacillus sp. CGMCC 1.18879]MBY9083125.1 TetR family transcriptional regulator [Paenibacillus sinensis]
MSDMNNDSPKPGLRERKKIKTRATIQENAMRLFREQGYQATTVEQIAEASEISPSTFFRYFSTKEAVVLEDDYDPLLIESFLKQPPELSIIQALRGAVKDGFNQIPEDEVEGIWARVSLSYEIPELQAAMIQQIMTTVEMVANVIAQRQGCSKDELRVRSLAAAFVGIAMASQKFFIEQHDRSYPDILTEAVSLLEKGFTF